MTLRNLPRRKGESYPTGVVWGVISHEFIDGPFERFEEFDTEDEARAQADGQNAGRFMGGPAQVVHRVIPEWLTDNNTDPNDN